MFSSDTKFLCNNSGKIWFSDIFTSAGLAPLRDIDTLVFQTWVQPLPRNPAEVNAQKIMFDSYITVNFAQ